MSSVPSEKDIMKILKDASVITAGTGGAFWVMKLLGTSAPSAKLDATDILKYFAGISAGVGLLEYFEQQKWIQ